MRADAAHLPARQVHHPVGEQDRRQPVGHHQHRGALGPQARQDLGLDGRVDRGGGVVEHQQPRAAGQRTGQGDALALSAGERHAALPQHGVPAVGECVHEPGGAGPVEHPVQRPVGHVAAHEHVVGDRLGEQVRLLEHERHGLAQLGRVERRDAHPAQHERAGGGLVEPADQVDERRLAAAGGADERHGLARCDVERHAVEHRGLAGPERVVDVVERQPERTVGQVGAGAVALGRRVHRQREQVVDPGDRHDRARDRLEQEPDDAHGQGQPAEERDRLDQLARGRRTLVDPPRTGEQQDHDPQIGKERDQRLERRVDAGHADDLVAEVGRSAAEPLDLVLLEAHGLDHERAVKALVGDGRHHAEPLLDPGHGTVDPVGEVAAERGERREQQHRGQAEHPVGREQRRQREPDERHDAHRPRQRQQHLRRGVDVVVGVRQQLAGGTVPVLRQPHGQQAVHHVLAERDLHTGLGHGTEPAPHHDRRTPGQADPDHERHRCPDPGGGDAAVERRRDDLVGDPAQRVRRRDHDGGPQHAAEEREPERRRVQLGEPPDRRHPLAGDRGAGRGVVCAEILRRQLVVGDDVVRRVRSRLVEGHRYQGVRRFGGTTSGGAVAPPGTTSWTGNQFPVP